MPDTPRRAARRSARKDLADAKFRSCEKKIDTRTCGAARQIISLANFSSGLAPREIRSSIPYISERVDQFLKISRYSLI